MAYLLGSLSAFQKKLNKAYSNQSNKARGRKEEREKVVREILEKRRKKEEDV